MMSKTRDSQFYRSWPLITLAFIAVRAPDFLLPMNRDSGLFAYGGWRILHGELPYKDFWDNKLPGVFYINALAMKLFGVGTAGLVVFQMIYVMATAWAFFAVARKFCSHRASFMATFLFAFYHGGYGLSEDGNCTETYVGLPALIAVLLLLNWSRHRRGYLIPALTGKYEDMVKSGIVDPVKVCRSALENAASIAAMILTTESLISEKPEKEKPAPM